MAVGPSSQPWTICSDAAAGDRGVIALLLVGRVVALVVSTLLVGTLVASLIVGEDAALAPVVVASPWVVAWTPSVVVVFAGRW